MRKSLKSTYRKLLSNNPTKARKHKMLFLINCKSFIEETRYLKKNSQRILKKEGR